MRRAALIIAAASSLRFPGGAGVCGLIPAPPAARAAHARTTRTSRLCSSSSSSSSSLPMRLERILANRGVGSRSQVGKLIKQGRVQVRANGEFSVCKTPSMKVDSRAAVLVDGAEVRDPPLLVRYHKPKGVLSTIGDDWGRESLKEVLPEDLLKTYHPVGRLDADTSGLLLLSREGPLTHRLLSPGSLIEREYVAVVTPKENTNRPGQELIDALNAGIQTADGTYKARVTHMDGNAISLAVTEGKYRMVRRMLANAGYPVEELQRIRYGPVNLSGLEAGRTEPVDDDECVQWAQALLESANKKIGKSNKDSQASMEIER